MDLYVSAEGAVVRVEFVECMVRVAHNYAYESQEMRVDPVYRTIQDAVVRLNCGEGWLVDAMKDSHDVVEWLMLRMNCEAGKRLYAEGRGIFRSVVVEGGGDDEDISAHITGKARKYMMQYRNTTASYELAGDDMGHGLVGWGGAGHTTHTTHYAQITSPIRRFVDLINMTVMCEIIRGDGSAAHTHAARPFLTRPFLAHLNQQMCGIRRVQNDVALVAFGAENEGVVVEGVVVDVVDMEKGSRTNASDRPPHITVFVDGIGGGKSFSVPIREEMVVLLGDVVQLKVVSLPSKSTAYQKTRLCVV